MVTRVMLCLVIAAFAAPACAEATIELPNGAKCTLDDDFSVLACDNHIAVLPDGRRCEEESDGQIVRCETAQQVAERVALLREQLRMSNEKQAQLRGRADEERHDSQFACLDKPAYRQLLDKKGLQPIPGITGFCRRKGETKGAVSCPKCSDVPGAED